MLKRRCLSRDVVVEVRGLDKSYALGSTPIAVLNALELTMFSREIVAVMGPSGAGKSTLLSCVAGLDAPDRGTIRVLGHNLSELSDRERTRIRRKNLGIVYQFFNLIPNLDARENVSLPFLIDRAPVDEIAVDRALERVGMIHRKRHLPSQLSGGEMQLVSIARAIVRRPKLILADEPTGNVNVGTGRRIMTLLSEVLKESESAMLLVTHHPDDAANADRVLFLKDGEILRDAELNGADVSISKIHARLQELGI